MTNARSDEKYVIEFDSQGRIRIRDPHLARLILEHARMYDGLVVQVDATPTPLGSPSCSKVPPPVNHDGCSNGYCPQKLDLRFANPIEARWKKIQVQTGRRNRG